MIPPVPRPRNARPGGYPKAGSSIWEMLKPFAPAVGNAISDAGYGLATAGAGNMFAAATQRGAELDPYRDQQSLMRKQEEEQAAGDNATLQWFETEGFTDLVERRNNGEPMDRLYNEAMARKAQPEPVKGIEINGRLVNPMTGEEMGNYSDPAEPPKPTADIQEYNYALSQGYQGSFTDYQTEMRKAGATNIDFNANQGTAAAYADRMQAADQVLSDPALTAAMTDLIEQGKGNIPVAGNFLVSEEYQMAEQAQRDFVNAILRRESGAVISPSEFENAKKQYFPQPGDSQIVIEQKARNRRTAIEGVARAAGPNYAPPMSGGQQPVFAVNPTTGERLMLQNGQWVPAQ